MSEEDRELGPPERLHPLYLLTGIGRRLRGIAGAYAGMIYLAAKGLLTAAMRLRRLEPEGASAGAAA